MNPLRIIIFQDDKNKIEKQNNIIKLCKLDRDERVRFLEVNSHAVQQETLLEGALVYIMGGMEVSTKIPTTNHMIVGYGPSFDELIAPECRQTLVDHIGADSLLNLFDKFKAGIQILNPADLLEEKPALKLSEIPRGNSIPSLDGYIDDAISAIQYIKMEDITVALPELNTFVSASSTSNSMSYDELLGLLLVFKRLGSEKLYWKDKVVFKDV